LALQDSSAAFSDKSSEIFARILSVAVIALKTAFFLYVKRIALYVNLSFTEHERKIRWKFNIGCSGILLSDFTS
jgi:hypothetical protein